MSSNELSRNSIQDSKVTLNDPCDLLAKRSIIKKPKLKNSLLNSALGTRTHRSPTKSPRRSPKRSPERSPKRPQKRKKDKTPVKNKESVYKAKLIVNMIELLFDNDKHAINRFELLGIPDFYNTVGQRINFHS